MPHPDHHGLAVVIQPVAKDIGARAESGKNVTPSIAKRSTDFRVSLQLTRRGLNTKYGVARRVWVFAVQEVLQTADVPQGLG